MDKLKFRRSGIQARVLALTMFFTLGASLVIAASNMHQMTAEWERTTILNAEYALQTAASAIRRDVDEIDDLAGWCAYNPGMRTYLLTGDTASNQALSMYPTVSAKFNSMRTMAYILTRSAHQRLGAADNVRHGGHQCRDPDAGYTAAHSRSRFAQYRMGLHSPRPAGPELPGCQHDPHHPRPDPARYRPHGPCRIFVSPSLILSPLRSFTPADGGQLYWEMGENLYTSTAVCCPR